ncbi:MAG: hypothetical protein JO262_21065 [Solirubrobacterales bacterium]|nr:hypothetical protein [Solirubrobacterales bacterium]
MAIEDVAHRWKLAFLAFALCGAVAGDLVSAATGTSAEAPPAPVFGKSVDVAPVSGTVFVQRPGKPSLPLRTQSQIPLGSVLDAQTGTVQVTSATAPTGSTRVGTFAGAVFEVLQGKHDGGVTQMRFVREGFSDCAKASAAKIRHHRRYRAYAAADTGFVMMARDASSTPSTGRATWQVGDECDGTRTTPKTGAVTVAIPEQRRTLYPGTSAVDFCQPQNAPTDYCLRVDSFPSKDDFSFGVLRRGKPVPYQLCVSRPGRAGRCAPYRMAYIPRISRSLGVVECDRTLPEGTLLARWRVGGRPLGVPLTFASLGLPRGAAAGSCFNYPIARFRQTAAVFPGRGKVYVSAPGTKAVRLLAPRLVPVGSVIDARQGQLNLSLETTPQGGAAIGSFSGGAFRIEQPRSGNRLALLRLLGGSFARCASSAPDAQVRQLISTNLAVFGASGYVATAAGFRVAGRYASAVGHGPTTWLTADECDGTRSRPGKSGQILVSDAFRSSPVSSGEDELDRCSSTGPKPAYCVYVLSEPDRGIWGFGLGLARSVKQYNLCISGPNGSNPCYAAPMTPGARGRGIGDVTCTLNQGPGQYAVGWFLGTHEVGAPLRFSATQAIVAQLPAITCVLGTPTDSRAGRSVPRHLSASGHPESTQALRRP